MGFGFAFKDLNLTMMTINSIVLLEILSDCQVRKLAWKPAISLGMTSHVANRTFVLRIEATNSFLQRNEATRDCGLCCDNLAQAHSLATDSCLDSFFCGLKMIVALFSSCLGVDPVSECITADLFSIRTKI